MNNEEIGTDGCLSIHGDASSLVTLQIMQPTMNLRWSKSGKLQQLWSDINSYATEWREVPTEEAE